MSHCTHHEEVASEYGRGEDRVLPRFDLRWKPGHDVTWNFLMPRTCGAKGPTVSKGLNWDCKYILASYFTSRET